MVEGKEVVMEEVKIVKIASLASRNSFYPFMRDFLCLLTFFRPNTFIKFRLANVFKHVLINLSSSLKPST